MAVSQHLACAIVKGKIETYTIKPMKRRFFYLASALTCLVALFAIGILAAPQPASAASPAPATSVDAPDVKCVIHLDPFDLNWFVCPIMKGMVVATAALDSFVNQEMSIGSEGASSDPNQIFCDSSSTGKAKDSCQAYKKAWGAIRDLALGLMVIAGIVVLIAQALGFEFLDAYTIRKVLPNLLMAAVGITLSWQLMQFFVQLSNDLAFGIRFLIYQPFVGFNDPILGGGARAMGSLLAIGALTALGWIGLLSFLGTAALAVFVAVLILILRDLLIIMAIIFAPIAIVMYILPNTKKLYKFWWESFSKALLMFPLISGLIATGRVVAALSTARSDNSIAQLAGFAAYFMPYFTVPATFKFAGGALRNIGGFVNERGKGIFGGLKQYRGNTAKKNWQDLKTGNRLKGEDKAGLLSPYGIFARRFNAATRETANLKNAGYNPRRMLSRMAAARSTEHTEMAKEALEKNHAVVQLKADDDLVEAALYAAHEQSQGRPGGDQAVRAELQRRGYMNVEQGTAMVRAARNSMPTEAFDTAMAIASFGTSSGWTPRYRTDPVTGARVQIPGGLGAGGPTGAGGAREMINAVAGNDRQRALQILGASRQMAESKGRYDLSGGSFTEDAEMLDTMHHGGMTAAVATERVHRGALEGTGRGRVFGGHRRAVDALAPTVREMLDDSFGVVNRAGAAPAIAGAYGDPRAAVQQLAFAANSLDAASSNSAESAREFEDQVLSQQIDVRSLHPDVAETLAPALRRLRPDQRYVRYADLIEGMREDPEFGRYRREYRTGYEAAVGTPPPPDPGGP